MEKKGHNTNKMEINGRERRVNVNDKRENKGGGGWWEGC